MVSIRGAISVEENSKDKILENTKLLLEKVISINELNIDDIISIIFSSTKDLTKAYPAVAARELNIVDASLFCVQEMYVEESLPMCIRILMHTSKKSCQKDVKHVYLKNAKKLRPDLCD